MKTDPQSHSRRRFLQAVAIGGAAVAAPALTATPAAAFPEIEVVEEPLGRITLGGMLIIYVSAPLAARGNMAWTMSNTRSETFTAITEDSRELTISTSLGPFTLGGATSPFRFFSISGGVDRVQGSSTRVTNAITHASTQSQTIQTAPTSGLNTWENTAFLIMARPVLEISVNVILRDGKRIEPRADAPLMFRFVNGGTIFPRSARELRDDPGTRAFIGPETADSILAQYPLTPTQTSGVQLGLGDPRFALTRTLAPGSVPFIFSQSMSGTTTHRFEQSSFVTTRITSGFSLTISKIPIVKFQTTKSFTTRHTSVQEQSSTEVVSTTGVLSSDQNHLNHIYEDRVWNTLLITDEGPLPALFSAVSGTVTAPDGTPIPGAVVTMPVDGVVHEVVADHAGRYSIRTAEEIRPGSYEVSCAGVTSTVAVAPGRTARADYFGVPVSKAYVRTR